MSIASVGLLRPGLSAALPALLFFAWVLEAVGVACGIVNAAYTTFQNDFPSTLVGWLPALPLVVLASTELLRIPLAQAFQRKRRLVPRALALATLLPICRIALENWTFGIERIVNLRLAQVESRRETLRRAEDRLKVALDDRQHQADAAAGGRDALQRRIEEGRRQQEELGRQVAGADRAHADNLREIGTYCLKIGGECLRPRSLAEDARYAAEKKALDDKLERVLAGVASAERELQAMAAHGAAAGFPEVAEAQSGVAAARKAFAAEAGQNQIYRLAGMYHGVPPEHVGEAELAHARGFFSLFSASIVSLAGVLAALIYYWPDRDRSPLGEAAAKLLRGLRGLIARRRRRVVRIERVEVPVEKIVEKLVPEQVIEKPILIERQTVRWVPYTGSGPVPEPHITESRTEGKPAEAALTEAREAAATRLRVYK